MKCLIPAIVLLAIPFSAPAAKPVKCNFKISCEALEQKFTINFKSLSGKCAEDDMELILEGEGREKTSLKVKDDWYTYTDHIVKDLDPVCKGDKQVNPFASYIIAKDKVVLFVKSSGRPGYDNVNAILLDPVKGQALDTKKLGRTKNTYVAALPTKNGFKLRLIRDSLSFNKDVTCDCDAPFVDDWHEVTVKGTKLQSKWMKN